MIHPPRIIRDSARRVADAIEGTRRSYVEGRISQEPQFTDRMIGRIEQAMDGLTLDGVTWTAHTLSSSGPGTDERTYGADFLGVLEIDLPEYSVKKGFLAQAKRGAGRRLAKRDFAALQTQCERMLALSPDSFVFVYTRKAVSVVPALSLASGSRRTLGNYYAKSAKEFFELHFQSFIGDRRLSGAHIGTLDGLRQEVDARVLLLLRAST